MQEKTEITRKLVDLALSTGRHYQSAQTGYLHYFHAPHADLLHHTIPIYDNVLYILALFRSRVVENIREAQNLLESLLNFQTEDGNFPFYLHEYPASKSFSLPIRLLAPFYWILKLFGHVLGQELRYALETSIKKMVHFLLDVTHIKSFNFPMTVRFAGGLLALGRHLNENEWQEKGKQLLKEIDVSCHSEDWLSTSHIADILIAFSMSKEGFDLDNWDRFIHFCKQSWHAKLATYCGPRITEHQFHSYPVVSLYELFMGYLSGQCEIRTNHSAIELLEAVLIFPIPFFETSVELESVDQFSGMYKDVKWLCLKQPESALALLEKTSAVEERIHKTFTPFSLIWGDAIHPHSFVCQGGNAKIINYHWNNPVVELIFELEQLKSNDYDSAREICFFLDIYPELMITAKDVRTTVFELNQLIQITLQNGKELTIKFELLEGKGNFLGHIAQANRPSQLKQVDVKKLQVYDWIIFLRTLRRSEKCKIKVVIDLSKMF